MEHGPSWRRLVNPEENSEHNLTSRFRSGLVPDFLSNPNFDRPLQSGITRINCAAAAF